MRHLDLIYPVLFQKQMASRIMDPIAGVRDNNEKMIAVDRMPEEMSYMKKIRDDKVDARFDLVGFLICCPSTNPPLLNWGREIFKERQTIHA